MAYLPITGIYRIHCSGNMKIYIGSAVSIRQRLACHFSMLRRGTHTNKHLQNACDKYGIDSLSADILQECDEGDRIRLEQEWIDLYEAANPEYGMNNSWTASTSVGFKHSDATKERLSDLARGRDNSHLLKNAEAMRGKPAHNKGTPGKKWTDAQRESASASRKGRTPWNRGIPKPESEKKQIAETCKRKMIEKRGITREVQEAIIRLRAEGNSYPKIAKAVGVSVATCQRYALAHGFQSVGQGSRNAIRYPEKAHPSQ